MDRALKWHVRTLKKRAISAAHRYEPYIRATLIRAKRLCQKFCAEKSGNRTITFSHVVIRLLANEYTTIVSILW